MAKLYDHIIDEQANLIESASMFFVATTDPEGTDRSSDASYVNLSTKGGTPQQIIDKNRVTYIDYTGSGNETARHSVAGGPITVMMCSVDEENAATTRLYGTATVTTLENPSLASRLLVAPAEDINLPTRQVIDIEVKQTQKRTGDTECRRCLRSASAPSPILYKKK